MLYVVTGGACSGKSEYAERLAFSKKSELGGKLYYIATMCAEDDESLERIASHRQRRDGKGFETIECPYKISALRPQKNSVLLIECMSNLLANEMFITGNIASDKSEALEHIIKPIIELSRYSCVIAVTNEVFSDGMSYDKESMKYIEILGFINGELSAFSDGVFETVCSVPIAIKGELQC